MSCNDYEQGQENSHFTLQMYVPLITVKSIWGFSAVTLHYSPMFFLCERIRSKARLNA